MGLRLRKSIRLLPGVKLNLSKTGASVSLGKKGLSYNIGKKGRRTTVGLPGSGISYSSYSPNQASDKPGTSSKTSRILWIVVVVAVMVISAVYF